MQSTITDLVRPRMHVEHRRCDAPVGPEHGASWRDIEAHDAHHSFDVGRFYAAEIPRAEPLRHLRGQRAPIHERRRSTLRVVDHDAPVGAVSNAIMPSSRATMLSQAR